MSSVVPAFAIFVDNAMIRMVCAQEVLQRTRALLRRSLDVVDIDGRQVNAGTLGAQAEARQTNGRKGEH